MLVRVQRLASFGAGSIVLCAAGAAAQAARSGAPAASATPFVVPAPAPPARSPEKPSWNAQLLAALSVQAGIAPRLAPGVGVELHVGRDLGPDFALLAGYNDSFELDRGGATMRFSLLSAALMYCPITPRLTQRLWLKPCVAAQFGVQRGEALEDGVRVVEAESASKPWSAGMLTARLAYRGGALALEAGPALVFPFTRHEFVLENPGELAYRAPVAALGAALAAGVSF